MSCSGHYMDMMVMPSSDSGPIVNYWAGRYPGRIGWLVGPAVVNSRKKKFREWIPYACDNDAFTAFRTGQTWSEENFFGMLDYCRLLATKPLWVLVPDVVEDKVATLKKWELYAPQVARYGWPLAFAVQDGMFPGDVPSEAQVIFVGGSTEWKWRTLFMWTNNFNRVHVGRVNELRRLWYCERLGVESIDGTGWFRGTDEGRQGMMLRRYMEGEKEPAHYNHPELDLEWHSRINSVAKFGH